MERGMTDRQKMYIRIGNMHSRLMKEGRGFIESLDILLRWQRIQNIRYPDWKDLKGIVEEYWNTQTELAEQYNDRKKLLEGWQS